MNQHTPSTILLLCILASSTSAAGDDTDGDGLTDPQEIHKYFTDPGQADSDGDGVPDGDWHERREYAYTVRSVVKVMRPCNIGVVNDDYQDARVLSETQEYVELEFIHYPFNTNAETIAGRRDWKEQPADLKEYLQPGITTNWDEELQKDVIRALEEDGVHLERLTDRQIVEQASRWLMGRAEYHEMFGTYFVHFPEGEAKIFPGLEERFERENSKTPWPVPEHFEHELFGKGMFYNRSRGSCTSTAVYLTTGLRALGIPTRMIIGIPVVDSSDPDQVEMIEKHISHHEVRRTLLSALAGMGNSFSAHTFNEVFVGGRWHRLNYNTLGQNSYGDGAMGLLTHVHTFNDLSEANLTATWGLRYGRGDRDEVFQHSNPYRATEISDRFGLHCDLSNPPVEEIKEVRITKAYWFFSPERPKWIREDYVQKGGDGHLLAHAEMPFEDLRVVYAKLNKAFVLRAQGQPPVHLAAERGYWNSECYLRVPAEQYARMKPGVPYQLEPVATEGEYRWVVEPGVVLVKSDRPSPASPDEAPESMPGETAPVSPDDEKGFAHVLDFRLGKREFAEGDEIVITEIRGTRPRFEIGGRYLVRGRYTLSSQDSAMLCLYRTTKKRVSVPGNKNQTMQVEKGSGTFALEKVIHYEGYLHLSFYPSGGGGGFGGLYFGQDDQDTLPGQEDAGDATGGDKAFSVAAILFHEEALDRPHDVELQGDLAFVPGKGGSIAIIDVGDPANPKILWHQHDAQRRDDAETVLPLGEYLLLGTNDLISIDVRDPRAPRFLKTVSDRSRVSRINGMVRRGDHVFAASKDGWIDLFDVSDPTSPTLVGALNTRENGELGWPHDLDRLGDHLVVVDPAGFGRRGLPGKMGIYRVADPATHKLLPVEAWKLVGVLENHDLVGANRVQVKGGYAFVGGSRGDRPSNAVVVDISDPTRPVQVAVLRFSDTRGPNGLTVAGDVLFLAGGQTVEAIDVSQPTGPVKLAAYRCLEAFAAGRDSAHDLVYRDGYLYVTGQNDHSFCILRVDSGRIRELAARKAR